MSNSSSSGSELEHSSSNSDGDCSADSLVDLGIVEFEPYAVYENEPRHFGLDTNRVQIIGALNFDPAETVPIIPVTMVDISSAEVNFDEAYGYSTIARTELGDLATVKLVDITEVNDGLVEGLEYGKVLVFVLSINDAITVFPFKFIVQDFSSNCDLLSVKFHKRYFIFSYQGIFGIYNRTTHDVRMYSFNDMQCDPIFYVVSGVIYHAYIDSYDQLFCTRFSFDNAEVYTRGIRDVGQLIRKYDATFDPHEQEYNVSRLVYNDAPLFLVTYNLEVEEPSRVYFNCVLGDEDYMVDGRGVLDIRWIESAGEVAPDALTCSSLYQVTPDRIDTTFHSIDIGAGSWYEHSVMMPYRLHLMSQIGESASYPVHNLIYDGFNWESFSCYNRSVRNFVRELLIILCSMGRPEKALSRRISVRSPLRRALMLMMLRWL